MQRNAGDKLSTVFHVSEAHVYFPMEYPNYSLSDANPRIALFLMAVFCKCQRKIYVYQAEGWKEEGK